MQSLRALAHFDFNQAGAYAYEQAMLTIRQLELPMAAVDWGTYVTVHAYTPKAVRRAVEAGVKCIEHGQLLDEAIMKDGKIF